MRKNVRKKSTRFKRTINSKSAKKSPKSIYICTKFRIKGYIHISKLHNM